jgi:HAD superfamily phosphoserine phosphatase-like hydrolase
MSNSPMTYANESAFREKITHFKQSGPSKIHLVFDFDRTLTVRHANTDEDITAWHIMQAHLPEEGKASYLQFFRKYRALELEGKMTTEDAVTWWSAMLDLFVRYQVNMRAVESDFLHRASIRPGTAELFRLCHEHGIPAVILSAGIRDVIEVWSRTYDIRPSLILSTALQVDASGRVVEWQKDTLVHIFNKHEADHHELIAIRKARPNAIVIGDGLSDADMAGGSGDILRIRVFDPRPDEVFDMAEVRDKTFQSFDAMIEGGNFEPLNRLLAGMLH